jgi:hypothetical protein
MNKKDNELMAQFGTAAALSRYNRYAGVGAVVRE